ncbi:hypothetical protein D3C71_1877410 [compost metagenome]
MVLHPGVSQFRFVLHWGEKLFRIVCVIAGDLRAKFHFPAALSDEFPHILTGDFCQLFAPAIDQIRQLMQHRQTLFDSAFRPVGMVKGIRRF